jgi:outer membrane immunogenic protein
MKQFLFAIVTVLALTSGARAADMAARPTEAPAAVPAFSWTGFYLGVHGGYGWGRDPLTVEQPGVQPPTFDGSIHSKGYVAGGHAGYNWQYGLIVAGLELDVSANGIKGSNTTLSTSATTVATSTFTEKFTLLSTVRARLGFLPLQSVLLYVTGGAAWTQLEAGHQEAQQISFGGGGPPLNISSSDTGTLTLFGLAGGGGVEFSLVNLGMSNVLVRAEYLHYDFGKGATSANTTNGALLSTRTHGRITADVVRGGLSIKF